MGLAEFEQRRRGPSRHSELSASRLESSRAGGGSHQKYVVLFFRSRHNLADGSGFFGGVFWRGEERGGGANTQHSPHKFIPLRVTVARRRPGGRRRDADESDGVLVMRD